MDSSTSISKPSSAAAAFMDSEMRRRSGLISMTFTLTSWPAFTTWAGVSMWRMAISEMCTRPSMDWPSSMNAPNGTILVTLPSTMEPTG